AASSARIGKYATTDPVTASLALVRGNQVVALVTGIDLPAAAGVREFGFVDGTGAAVTLPFQAGDRLAIVNDSAVPLPVIGTGSTAYAEAECALDRTSGALSGCGIAATGWRLQVDLGVDDGGTDPGGPTDPGVPDDPGVPTDPGPDAPVTDCPSGIAADGLRVPTASRPPTSLVGFDLAKDGANRLRGALVTSLTDNLVERLPSGRGAYYSSATRAAAYSLAGTAQTLAWSEHHDVTLDTGLLMPCEAVYATLTPGGPAQPLLWSESGGLDHLDAAVDSTGRLALVATDAAPLHKDVRAIYWPAVRRDGAYALGTGTRLPLRGVESVKVATAGGRVAIAVTGFGRLAVYAGPLAGPLTQVHTARRVDASALDVAVARGGKPVVSYSSHGRLHLLIGGKDVDTRYPAWGAAMALSKSGTVAHLAWSVKPTAAPCSTPKGLLYDCAGPNGMLVADAALSNGRPRHVRLAAKFADGVAPQVVVGPGDRAAAYFIPSTSRRLIVKPVP
ncbi:hypothetical protein, partial [Nocardioides sp.]|uniref:hypothetical protein n=1 Tax=Nocardioides sp. TaxID=35761 RepID=UPI002ED998CF